MRILSPAQIRVRCCHPSSKIVKGALNEKDRRRNFVGMFAAGPGATNLVTGIATAMMDSSPVVFITGQVAAHLIGGDAFQETDVTGITLPITKHNYLVTRADEIAAVVGG